MKISSYLVTVFTSKVFIISASLFWMLVCRVQIQKSMSTAAYRLPCVHSTNFRLATLRILWVEFQSKIIDSCRCVMIQTWETKSETEIFENSSDIHVRYVL